MHMPENNSSISIQLNPTTGQNEYLGTSKAFESAGIMLNDTPLNQITVNSLGKHKLIEIAGEGDKPARGKTPTLYRLVNKPGMQFSKKD